MPVYQIPRSQHVFPDPNLAHESGLLGVGGSLEPGRLLLAYRSGIFPWYSAGQPILWWSPDPRMVLFTNEVRIPRSLRKRVRRGDYRITMDRAFREVIDACAATPRPGQDGTWITDEMKEAYCTLADLGFAHSIEAWEGDDLVGGLYGVAIGGLYSGESMFARAPDASKVAFVVLMAHLAHWGFPVIDCQMHTEHLARFGAREVPRTVYLSLLADLREQPGRYGRWKVDPDLDPLAALATAEATSPSVPTSRPLPSDH